MIKTITGQILKEFDTILQFQVVGSAKYCVLIENKTDNAFYIANDTTSTVVSRARECDAKICITVTPISSNQAWLILENYAFCQLPKE